MKLAATLVIVLAATGTAARADDQVAFGPPGPDEPAAIMLGIGVGATNMGPGGQWLVEAAYRPVDDLPIRAHAMFAKGSGDFEDYGGVDHYQVRAGAEFAACGKVGVFCFVLDADAGMLHMRAADFGPTGGGSFTPSDRDGFLLAGRGGFDAGGRNARFRLMLDIAGALRGPFLVYDSMGSKLDLSTVASLEAELMVAF